MNPFDRARIEAGNLRGRLLEHCWSDAPTSIELLKWVEKELEISIEHIPPTHPILGGGSAVLIRDEYSIYVRNDIEQTDLSYLVAHELGHWILDAEKSKVTIAQLASLSNWTETPGVAKVEAYGARERQELQANVFARELLLPRKLAHQLWEIGKSPYDIVNEFFIPLELVRLQLLDAVLLPITVPLPPTPLPQPSQDQRQAAEASERFVNVVAGPGTGKTTTLIHRVKYLIEQRNIDPSKILVLTFTNKAAFELVERLRNAGIGRASEIWAGTFHAFGLEFLRKFYHLFQLENNVKIADKLHQILLLIKELPHVDLKYYVRLQDPYDWLPDVVACINRLKEDLVSPTEYRHRIATLVATDELKLQREDVATLYEAHERALFNAKMVDFVDLVAKPALTMRDARGSVLSIANQYEHVLVDEYQDVTEVMVLLVRQLAHNAKSLWVVGDIRQAIHHWRGASIKSLLRFETYFRPGTGVVQKYALNSNRRSTTEIVEVFSQAGRDHALQQQLPLENIFSLKGNGFEKPTLISSSNSSGMDKAIADEILMLHSQRINYRDQAVVCRRGAAVEDLAEYLRAKGIPILYLGELSQRTEIKQIVCLMQLLCERKPRALIGLIPTNQFSMPISDIEIYLEKSSDGLEWQRGRWLGKAPQGVSYQGVIASQSLRALLQGFDRHTNPWDFVCDIILNKRFCIPNSNDKTLEAQTIRIALWQFAYSVRNSDGDMRQARLSRYLIRQQLRQRIGETYSDREMPSEASGLDAVRMLTIHGSKGLEFEAVHVGYIDQEDFGFDTPKWISKTIQELVPPEVLGSSEIEYKQECAIERNNLLYVALSRAKTRLRMYVNTEYGDKVPPQIKNCGLKIDRKLAAPALERPPQKVFPANSSVVKIKFEDFMMFDRCSMQFFYRRELGLSNEQDIDISIRARWAVMDTLKEILKNGSSPKSAFEMSWKAHQLPEPTDDPNLYDDAIYLCKKGIEVIKSVNGSLVENVVVKILNIEVELPWMIRSGSGILEKWHIINFSVTDKYIALFRPLLLAFESGTKNLTIHTLLPEGETIVPPSSNPEKTAAYKAAKKLHAGHRSAAPGKNCARCSFLTICPVVP